MDQVSSLVSLGQYGLVGVMLALILLTAFACWMLYKIVSNHIEHNTAASVELTKTLERLSTLIETKLK